MSSTTVTFIVVGVIVIAVAAWLLYKAGFKVKEITAKAGPLEAKMERPADGKSAEAETPGGAEVSQRAGAGGLSRSRYAVKFKIIFV